MATSLEHNYRYGKKNASTVRMASDETPDHKWCYVRRVDTLIPHATPQYIAKCSCRLWQSKQWLPFKQARIEWEKHMVEALKQGVLF